MTKEDNNTDQTKTELNHQTTDHTKIDQSKSLLRKLRINQLKLLNNHQNLLRLKK